MDVTLLMAAIDASMPPTIIGRLCPLPLRVDFRGPELCALLEPAADLSHLP